MSDNISKDEIRRAIDRLQIEHPLHYSVDVTKFNDGTDFSALQRAIDVIAKKCAEDADVHIICEMAKLYLDGVKPTIEPKRLHGKWEWKSPTPKTIMTPHCNNCGHMNEFLIETNFCPTCGTDMRRKVGEAE